MKRRNEEDEISDRHVLRLAKKESDTLFAHSSLLKDTFVLELKSGDCPQNDSPSDIISCTSEIFDFVDTDVDGEKEEYPLSDDSDKPSSTEPLNLIAKKTFLTDLPEISRKKL